VGLGVLLVFNPLDVGRWNPLKCVNLKELFKNKFPSVIEGGCYISLVKCLDPAVWCLKVIGYLVYGIWHATNKTNPYFIFLEALHG
jgi:hypothetical protein